MALYRYQVEGRTEKDFKEKADQTIEADIQVEPSVFYSVGEIHDVIGVGGIFEGGYKIKNVHHVMNKSGFATTLKATRVRNLLGKTTSVNKAVSSNGKEKAQMKKIPDKKHTVKKGDTLSKIALKYTGSANNWKKIEEYNRSKLIARDKRNSNSKGHWIYPGMELIIPGEILK